MRCFLLTVLIYFPAFLFCQNCEDPNSTFEFVGSQNTYFCEGPTGIVTVDITVDENNDPACISSMKLEWGDGVVETLAPNFFGNKTHVYNFPDSIACSLTADDLNPEVKLTLYFANGKLNKRTQSLAITPLPRAQFSVSGSLCVGQPLSFSNTGCWGDSFLWNYGNGQTSTGEDGQVTYSAPGTYFVKLVATNECGSDSLTIPITIRDRPNIVSLSALATTGCVPFETSFSANATGINLNGYEWKVISTPNNCTGCAQFIPATGKDSVNPVIRFTQPGPYVVQLIGSNECGNDTATIQINAAAPPSVTVGAIPNGCNSLTVNFDAQLIGYQGTVATYAWTFPTGASISTSSSATPGNVTFTQSGTVQLTLFGPCDTVFQSIPIVVNSQSPVAFTAPPANLCTSSAPFTLQATPEGGTFSGTGVSGGIFNPATAGAGSHVVTYQQGVPGCESQGTITIDVSPADNLTIGGNLDLCNDAGPLTLTANLEPGVWVGNGVTGNQFDPASADLGPNTLTYTYTSSTGCVSTQSRVLTVVARPVVNVPDTIYTCNIPTPVDLVALGNITFSPATSTPGSTVTWTGLGVSGNGQFTSLGVGNYPMAIAYSIPPGCDTTVFFVLKVSPFVAANAGADATICTSQNPYTLNAQPPGGQWYNNAGDVVSNPITLPAGTHVLTYRIQENTPCASSDNVTITVVGGNAVNAGADLAVCETAATFTLPVNPGLTWSGPSLSGNTVNVSALAPGNYNYTLTDPGLPAACNTDVLGLKVGEQPAATFTLSTDTACVGVPVTLLPTSTLPGVQFLVNWGDGSPTGSALTHTYAAPGDFTITLTANTFQGAAVLCTNTDNAPIYVITPPEVFDFELINNEGCGPLTVGFNNLSVSEDGTYFWDFGNGNTFVGPNPGPQVFVQGVEDTTYTVQLRLVTRCDTLVLTKTVLVHPQPRAGFGYSYPFPCSGNYLKLNLTSVGNPDTSTILTTAGHVIPAQLGQAYYLQFFTDSLPKIVGIWVITQNDCGVDTAYQEITVLPADVVALINLNQDSTVVCPGENVVLKSYSTPGALLRWKDLTTGETFVGDSLVLNYAQPGEYFVVLYAEGCGYDSTVVKIRVRVPPPVNLVVGSPGCPGEPIPFTVVSPAGTLTQLPDGTSSLLKNFTHVFDLPSGTYPVSVVATDQYGCTNAAQSQLYLGTPPGAGIQPVPPVCANASFTAVQNSTGAVSYAWTVAGQTFDGPQFTTSIPQSGLYLLTLVAQSSEGCRDTSSVVVNVLSTPTAIFEDSVLVRCAPSQVQFTNKSLNFTGLDWFFSDGSTSQAATLIKEFTNGGTVDVALVASKDGLCFDTARATYQLPVTPANLLQVTRHCTVDSGYTLRVLHPLSAGHTVALFGADTTWFNTYLITRLQPGTYDFEITSPEGCTNDTTVVLQPIAELLIGLPPDTTLLLGQSLLIATTVNQPDLTFAWSPELGLSSATVQNPTARPNDDTEYRLTVTNSLGCTKIDHILIEVLVNYDSLVYLPNAFTPGDQNGVNDGFGVRCLNDAVVELKYLAVYDLHGTLVFQADNCPRNLSRFTCEWDGTFRGNKAEAGVYTVAYAISYQDGFVKSGQQQLLLIR